MKRVLFYIGLIWRPVLCAFGLLAGATILLTYRLNSLVPGYSNAEVLYANSTKTLSQILADKVFLPAKLLALATQASPSMLRYISVALGILVVCLLFLILKSWHTTRVALLGSLLFLTSSWFLLFVRLGSPDIYLTLSLALIGLTVWLQHTNKRKLVVLSAAVTLGLLLYIPGMFWFVAIWAVWKRKYILQSARTVPFWYALLCLAIFLVILLPAALSVTNPSFAQQLLGAPSYLPSFRQLGLQVTRTLGAVFVNGNLIVAYSIGRQPVLDIFSFTMFIAGLASAIKHRDRSRNRYTLAGLLVTFILVSVGGLVTPIAMLPFIYIIIANGLAWMLQQWFAVFPKNPVARNTGVVLVVLATFFAATFNTYRYFVAWPHMEQTTNSYNQSL